MGCGIFYPIDRLRAEGMEWRDFHLMTGCKSHNIFVRTHRGQAAEGSSYHVGQMRGHSRGHEKNFCIKLFGEELCSSERQCCDLRVIRMNLVKDQPCLTE